MMRRPVRLLAASALLMVCVTGASTPARGVIETHQAMVDWINPAAMVIAEVVEDAKSETEGLDPMLMDDLAWAKIQRAAQSLEASSRRMARARTLRVGNHTAEMPGFANRKEIQAMLNANPAWFRRLAAEMADDSRELSIAAGRRDLRLTRDLAQNLNRSCQTCHTRFWEKPAPRH